VQEEVGSIDLGARIATTAAGSLLPFDFLIVAAGAETDFHGRDDLRERALTLHSVGDVLRLRAAVRDARMGVFVVAGGGYTGIEAATNIWRATRGQRSPPRIIIVETATALCAALPSRFQAYIGRNVRSLGIEARTEASVAVVSGETLTLASGEGFEHACLIWTAGVQTPDFVRSLPVDKTGNGRLRTDRFLSFAEGCFAAGDAAAFDRRGAPLRMSVQFSLSGGAAAAENVLRAARGWPLKEFRPFDPGYLVPMANGRACGLVLGVPLKGRVPLLLHYGMCLLRLRGWRQRRGLFRSLARL
jgi:NADH dehydrogenase